MAGDWPSTQLGDVIQLLTGYPFKSALYVDHPDAPRLLRGDNIAQGVLRWDRAKRWPQELTTHLQSYWLREDDVVIAMDRPWIDAGLKFASVRASDTPALLVQRVVRLRGSDQLHSRFLRYLIASRSFTEYVLAIQTGTAVPHISAQQIKEFEVALPPLAEQRAIADVLGALDDKIEQNRQTVQALERLARAIFRAWFVDFEPVRVKAAGEASFPSMPQHLFDALPIHFVDSESGPVPQGWHSGSLGDVIDIHNSRRVPLSRREREQRRGSFRYYGATGIIDYVNDFLFDGLFVLVGEDGTVVNDQDSPVVQYVWGRFWVNNHAHILTGSGGISTEYLRVLLDHINIRPFITGAVQPKLSQRNLKSVPILIPPPEAAAAFDDIIAPLFAWLRQAHDQSRVLESVRDLLLPRLLSGQIRVEVADG